MMWWRKLVRMWRYGVAYTHPGPLRSDLEGFRLWVNTCSASVRLQLRREEELRLRAALKSLGARA